MKLHILGLPALALLLALPTPAHAGKKKGGEGADDGKMPLHRLFKRFDTNQNGTIDTGAEADALRAAFAKNPKLKYLDTNNDGTLELLPAGAVILDGVGWAAGAVGDTVYGTVIPPLLVGGTQHPGAATRDPNNSTPLSAGAWFAGLVRSVLRLEFRPVHVEIFVYVMMALFWGLGFIHLLRH